MFAVIILACNNILLLVENALADAEAQLQKSSKMRDRRERFIEESTLHLKNIAQQIREMEKKGKQEIDLHYQKMLLEAS